MVRFKVLLFERILKVDGRSLKLESSKSSSIHVACSGGVCDARFTSGSVDRRFRFIVEELELASGEYEFGYVDERVLVELSKVGVEAGFMELSRFLEYTGGYALYVSRVPYAKIVSGSLSSMVISLESRRLPDMVDIVLEEISEYSRILSTLQRVKPWDLGVIDAIILSYPASATLIHELVGHKSEEGLPPPVHPSLTIVDDMIVLNRSTGLPLAFDDMGFKPTYTVLARNGKPAGRLGCVVEGFNNHNCRSSTMPPSTRQSNIVVIASRTEAMVSDGVVLEVVEHQPPKGELDNNTARLKLGKTIVYRNLEPIGVLEDVELLVPQHTLEYFKPVSRETRTIPHSCGKNNDILVTTTTTPKLATNKKITTIKEKTGTTILELH